MNDYISGNVRQFKLINKTGAEFNLMRLDAYLHNPDGLGFAIESEVRRVDNTFILLDDYIAQAEPSGEIIFKGYEQYEEFVRFVQVGGCVLGYKPLDVWRYLDVLISIGKSEISYENKKLICPVTFTAISEWYESEVVYETYGEPPEHRKEYNYTYPFTYMGGTGGTIEIHNGLLESYMRIIISGVAENPRWTLTAEDGTEKEGKVNAIIGTGNVLVIDSHPATMEIAEYTASGAYVQDRYGDSDFSTERIFPLPPGDSALAVLDDTSATIEARIEVRRRV